MPTLSPIHSTAVYTPATLDLSGWWQCVFTFTSWHDHPVDAENHPPPTPQLFCPPDAWQETTFIHLGYAPGNSHVTDFGPADDSLWANIADPAGGGDGLNGYLVQISDQRRTPTSQGIQESAGAWRVTAFVAVGGVGFLAALFGNTEAQLDGDVNYLIGRADNPSRDGSLYPSRPTFTGTWIDVSQPSAGTFEMSPTSEAPPRPATAI